MIMILFRPSRSLAAFGGGRFLASGPSRCRRTAFVWPEVGSPCPAPEEQAAAATPDAAKPPAARVLTALRVVQRAERACGGLLVKGDAQAPHVQLVLVLRLQDLHQLANRYGAGQALPALPISHADAPWREAREGRVAPALRLPHLGVAIGRFVDLEAHRVRRLDLGEALVQNQAQPGHEVRPEARKLRRGAPVRHADHGPLDAHVLAHQLRQNDARDQDPQGQEQDERGDLRKQETHQPGFGNLFGGRRAEAEQVGAAGQNDQEEHRKRCHAQLRVGGLLLSDEVRVALEDPLLQVRQGVADGDLHDPHLPDADQLHVVLVVDLAGLHVGHQRLVLGLQLRLNFRSFKGCRVHSAPQEVQRNAA
eukprot:scaffold2506_cov236-Pinguiococcus_pyrenoidosus.AAC.17